MIEQNLEAKLTNTSGVIASIFARDHNLSELQFEVLKRSDHATSLKVSFEGQAGFVKVYDSAKSSGEAFDREHRALRLFAHQDIPQLLLVAEEERLIMTKFIEGEPLLQMISPENIHQISEHLGQWFGRLSNVSPTQAHHQNWADYLAQYRAGLEFDIIDQQQPILEGSQIERLVLSHNDNALGNFIRDRKKRLFGVDFEDARMKPEGWDLLTSARSLFGQMPEQLPVISGSLLRGYQLTARNCTLPGNFDQIISTFAMAQAVAKA